MTHKLLRSKLLVPVLVSLTLIVAVLVAVKINRGTPRDRQIAAIAQRQGYPQAEFADIMRIKAKASGNEQDWERLVEISQHENQELVQNALGAFKKFNETSHREEALAILRTKMKSKDAFVRANALAVYWRMGASDWRQVMQAAEADPDSNVREWASRLLKEGDPKPSRGISAPTTIGQPSTGIGEGIGS